MIMGIVDYLDAMERLFFLSPVVRSFQVREREERLQEGFIRVRAVLSNGDILEAFEFVLAYPYAIQTQTYRIHWQGADGQLKRRWDNAPHYPNILTFPHHVHVGPSEHVESAEDMNMAKALVLVEAEILRAERPASSPDHG
ncbi:MAG TPA: DUF6516 family protein [Candidatus Tectomicrobia bacterium]